jgi:hypothetical protein
MNANKSYHSSMFCTALRLVNVKVGWKDRGCCASRGGAHVPLRHMTCARSGDTERFTTSRNTNPQSLSKNFTRSEFTTTVNMCGTDCFLMLLSVLFPPIGGT